MSEKRKPREVGKSTSNRRTGRVARQELEDLKPILPPHMQDKIDDLPAKRYVTANDNHLLHEELLSAKKEIAKRNKELAEIKKNILNANGKQAKTVQLSKAIKQNTSLTRQELADMGITIQSETFGKYANLTKEVKEQLNLEVAGAMFEKITQLLNFCFDEEKLRDASLKDASIAMGIITDKFRTMNGMTDKKVEVQHTLDLSGLINKNSDKKMDDIDFGDIIDVEAQIMDENTQDINLDDEE